ncbi:hypothetical protein F0562_012568 [Nyssa sinensis]|uniref:Helicase C-terminal domain-containing protein n=1 Tax=Nyssa sinensis TaxID=561372 RepID=A0A5J4ZWR3_9ASTE|nr:hypothetical protein F0562_012568 [Nyssa sinensis]
MDYSKVPLARRTRFQENLFFKQYYEDKKKAKSRGSGGDYVSALGENRESGVRVEGSATLGSGGVVVSESVAVCGGGSSFGVGEVGLSGVNVGDNEGVSSVNTVRAENSRSKKLLNSKTGSKKNKNVVRIDADSKKIRKSRKGTKKEKNVAPIDFGSEKFANKKRNVVRIAVVDDNESEDEIVFLRGVVQSSCSSLKTPSESGSKVRSDKGKNSAHMEFDEIVSSSGKLGEKINDGKIHGRVGISKKNEDVSDDFSVDLEGSEESESSSEEDNHDPDDEDYEVYNSCRADSSDKTSYGVGDEDDDGESSVMKRGTVGKEKEKERVVEVGLSLKRKVHHCPVVSLEQSSSYSVDGEGEGGNDRSIMMPGSFVGEDTERRVKDGLKRRKICGLVFVVDCSTEKNKENTRESKCVAERLRSRGLSKSKKQNVKFGTFSCPLPLDEDSELDSSSGYDDGDDDWDDGSDGDNDDEIIHNNGNTCSTNGNDAEYLEKLRGKDKGGKLDVHKILANSICGKGDKVLGDLVSSGDNAPCQETNPRVELPLKFKFEDEEDSQLLEKSEFDEEVEQLFKELDFALKSYEMGSDNSSAVDNDNTISLETGTDPTALCHLGKHQLVLDEQIGIRCEYCSFVKLEIKHTLPSFSKRPWGKHDRTDLCRPEHNIFDKLQGQNSGSEHQSGFNRFSKSGTHAPGTGKTRLTIVFLQTYLELFPTCRPVIIAPCSMLLTWEEEFRKWNVDIPFHNLNNPEYSGQESKPAMDFLSEAGHHKRNPTTIRLVKLYSWNKDRSILGVSYRLFEKLTTESVVADGDDKKQRKFQPCADGEQVRRILLEFPSLLVLDEGHTPRNSQSLIFKALSKMETHRRIILSGTPFQNNFGELYNTLCLVRPKFDDRMTSENYGVLRKKRGRKSSVARVKWASLTSSICKDADDKLRKLRALIDPFVHVHRGTILQESLPGLRDALVVLQPTPLQKTLLEGIQGKKNPIKLGYLVSLISVHPSLLPECCLSKEGKSFIDRDKLNRLKLNPGAGVKTRFLMNLIQLSNTLNEKVLVFSQYIDPLAFIMDQLHSHFNWTLGKEVLCMDGKLDVNLRQSSISTFNDPNSEVKVLLASTKACSEGINLVGASRVALLDVVWNPSVERQAISRAYRIGQKKVVYVYHLITSGTIEGEKYLRQAEKDRLSELVFSSADGEVYKRDISSTVSEDKILEEMVRHDKLKDMFEKILNQPKESDLIETFGMVDL